MDALSILPKPEAIAARNLLTSKVILLQAEYNAQVIDYNKQVENLNNQINNYNSQVDVLQGLMYKTSSISLNIANPYMDNSRTMLFRVDSKAEGILTLTVDGESYVFGTRMSNPNLSNLSINPNITINKLPDVNSLKLNLFEHLSLPGMSPTRIVPK